MFFERMPAANVFDVLVQKLVPTTEFQQRSSNYIVGIKSWIFQLHSRNKSEGFPITEFQLRSRNKTFGFPIAKLQIPFLRYSPTLVVK